MIEISKTFTFEAAHCLPELPVHHPCRRLHGHSYRFTVFVKGDRLPMYEWVLDYGDIRQAVAPVLDELDHRYLNEIEGLRNPTAENLAVWIWEKLKPRLSMLSRIEVRETKNTSATYTGF